MFFKIENIKKIDPILVILIVLLCIVGGLTTFSTTFFPDRTPSQIFLNQLLFYTIGLVFFLSLSTINYRKLINNSFITILFITTAILLISVLFFGENILGAKRWINFGFFTLQPSELTKISIIFIASFALVVRKKIESEKIFNVYEIDKGGIKNLVKKFVASENFLKIIFSFIALVVFSILILLQKSLGNTILLVLIYFGIFYSSIKFSAKLIGVLGIILLGINASFGFISPPTDSPISFAGVNPILLGSSLLVVIFLSKMLKIKLVPIFILFLLLTFTKPLLEFGYNNVLEDYQRNRVETFIQPDESLQLTDDYNRRQSIRAIGSGQFLGNGFLDGNIVQLNLLPFAFTDFAFAAYAEQFGFAGSIFLFSLYFLLIIKIIRIGESSEERFGRYFCYGVAFMIFLNSAQHIGMNLGLLPITGVPLPLVSSGGSAILTIFIGLGIVQSIQITEDEEKDEFTNFSKEFGVKRS